MLYLYKSTHTIFITTEKLFNFDCEIIGVYNCDVIDYNLVLSKFNTNPVNSTLIPTRNGFIVIISSMYELKLFEPLDILKDYSILETDLVFEIYRVNGAIKVYPYPFAFDRFYIECTLCQNLTYKAILTCINCKCAMCENCSSMDNNKCDNCVTDEIFFVDLLA